MDYETDTEQATDEATEYYHEESDQAVGHWDGQEGYGGYDEQAGGEYGMPYGEFAAPAAHAESQPPQEKPLEEDGLGQMLVGAGVAVLFGEEVLAAAATEVVAHGVIWAAEHAKDALEHVGSSDSGAWANEDHEDHPEEGALEIEARVDTPINEGGTIQITGTNWRGMSHAKERALKAQGGTIQELGLNLRITVDTPHGETHCEVNPKNISSPTVPEKDNLQKAMIWLITGQWENLPDHMAVVGAAAALGTYMMQKPVSELHFD